MDNNYEYLYTLVEEVHILVPSLSLFSLLNTNNIPMYHFSIR